MCSNFFTRLGAGTFFLVVLCSASWSQQVPSSDFQGQLKVLVDPFYLSLSDEQKPQFKLILTEFSQEFKNLTAESDQTLAQSTTLSVDYPLLTKKINEAIFWNAVEWGAGGLIVGILTGGVTVLWLKK
jgi:hypothetical protein